VPIPQFLCGSSPAANGRTPGAQLHLTDVDGWRITCFATNTQGPGWTLAALETRRRLRARAEDRIRALKDTGMRNPHRTGWATRIAIQA
jgi:hypothetical protein